VCLIESQHIQVFIREQIPERGAENREVIWESKHAALDGDDERGGDVDQEEQLLIEDQPGNLYLQILEWQRNLRAVVTRCASAPDVSYRCDWLSKYWTITLLALSSDRGAFELIDGHSCQPPSIV